jgi:penicillin amidase
MLCGAAEGRRTIKLSTVSSRRILTIINLSIAVLLFLFLFAAYWYAYRPLPKNSGEISAPIAGNASIVRDSLGVPHITASTSEDAIFLQAYVTAEDRMWQMDALRRLAGGDLAEIVGKRAIQTDEEARRLRMRRLAEEHCRTLPDADLAVLAAYARGVNYYLETHRGRYGIEFALLGYDPRPWSVVDSLLAGMQMFRILTTTWRNEIVKQTMLESGDRAKVDYLFPVRTGPEPLPGSNAWAIAGSHTARGKPILANDPHLDFAIPSTWYMIHLKAPGLNVTGVSLPGVPAVIIGHNDRIAWGVTNLHYDVQDLYREQLNPQTGQYIFRGQTEQARAEASPIAVKGEKSVQVTVWVTRHGPIFLNEAGKLYSLRWTAAEPNGFAFPFLDIDRARNWTEFTGAIARFPGPGQNFVYADVDGNIGYHAAGLLPVRRKYSGDLPADGSSGEYEWDGFIPFDQLPAYYNPSSGLIVTANQNPFPADYQYAVNGNFASYYRSRQIRDLLTKRNGWRPADMLSVQKDVYSGFARFLAWQLVAAYDHRKPNNPSLPNAVDLLRNWDGQMDKDSAAALVMTMAYQEIRRATANVAAPGKGQAYEFQIAPAVIEKLLRERPSGWFSDWDQMLIKCFADGIEEGAKRQGGNVKGWRYGQYNLLTIVQPVDSQLPMVGKYFNIGPVPMSGSSTTVKQTTQALGPSMRMVVDLSDLDKSLNNITVGESGHFLSSHYNDQWNSYYVGRSYPMQVRNIAVKSELRVRPLGP